jgi:poly-gamma-glutamate capsule biosynthesis protein CapA/YwtB (metallophosphatase superfamily)
VLGVVAAAVVGIGIAALLITQVFDTGSDTTTSTPNAVISTPSSPATAGSGKARRATRVAHGTVTVSVLNGTSITNLARSASDKLTKAGFKGGAVGNDTTVNGARSATAIFFAPGRQDAALEVAKTVNVGRDAVQPMSAAVRALSDGAQVVVSVGADQAQ